MESAIQPTPSKQAALGPSNPVAESGAINGLGEDVPVSSGSVVPYAIPFHPNPFHTDDCELGHFLLLRRI